MTKQLESLAKAKDSLEQRLRFRKFKQYRPYGHPDTLYPNGKLCIKENWESWSNKPWQLDFHNTKDKEKGNICANGVGKSLSCLWEVVAHLLGEYPKWYKGFKFEKKVRAWVGAIDASLQVEGVQQILLGEDLEGSLGTGLIPRDRIKGKPKLRQSGVPNTVHQVIIEGNYGYSHLIFKTYAQGWKAWQTAAPDVVCLDEQPDDNDISQKKIFEECQTRIFRSSGMLLAGLTPLLGETDLTRHFMYPKAEGIYLSRATWDDVGHLKEKDKDRLRKTYPGHSVESRTLGVPMMGEGRVFDVNEDEIKTPRIEIPRHFARIAGIDFGVGVGHPTAGAWLAHDRDRDIVYLYDEYRKEAADSLYHAEAFKKRSKWIPVSWPHDGHKTSDLTRDKSSGQSISDVYRGHGLNLLPISARYKKDIGGAQDQWPIIDEMEQRMKTGRFLVFSDLNWFFEEFRSFHRKEGKIVNRREDTIKAVMYALMMLRYAYTETIPKYKSSFRGLRANP